MATVLSKYVCLLLFQRKFVEGGRKMASKNEHNVDRELPEQNVQPRTGRQTHGDIHRVRGGPPGSNLDIRARRATSGQHFSIQETRHVHRVRREPPESNLDRRTCQRGRTGTQETGHVHRVMCLIRGDVVLNQSPGLDLGWRAYQGNMGTARGRSGIQESGDVHSVIRVSRDNPGTFFDHCEMSKVT